MPRPDTADSLLKLLVTSSRMFERRLDEQLRADGYDDVRPAHYAVFRALRPEGSRISALAAEAGMTPQSMGELVTDLERTGYVERHPDPDDGRARRVVATEAGRRAVAAAAARIADIEDSLGCRMGTDRLAELTAALADLTRALASAGGDER